MERERLVSELADAIDELRRDHTVRVAVDGVGASGKTFLADELATALIARGRKVIRASIDGFHRPREMRHARGSTSPEGYLDDSFDYGALAERLLEPLGPGGSGRYRTAVFDFRSESAVESPELTAAPGTVLVFDGVFVLRDELVGHWDFAVFVDTGFDVTLERALERDVRLFGSREATRERYERRYIPGERLYLERCRPRERANAVVANDEPADAGLEWRNRQGSEKAGGNRRG